MCVHHFRWAHIEKGNTMAQSSVTITIENEDPRVEVLQEYGMRYPDGSVKWSGDTANFSVSFRGLAEGNRHQAEQWSKTLESRAAASKIDLASYTAAHQLIKRSIIAAVTAPEDVS